MPKPTKRKENKQTQPRVQPLVGSEHPPHPKTKRLEATGADEMVTIQLIVRRRPGGPPLKDLDYFQKVPIGKRKLPSRLEFREAHGATAADLHAVGEFCRSNHLQVVESERSRRWVVARGTAAQMNSAFHVKLHDYQSPLGKYHGFEGAAQLPAALHGVVEAIMGLDNRQLPIRRHPADPPGTGPTITPQLLSQLYDFPSGTGLGQTIGIYEGAYQYTTGGVTYTSYPGYTHADLVSTLSNWGLTAPTPIDVGTNGSVSDGETIMDIALSSAIAQKAKIAVYFNRGLTSADVLSTITSMIHPTGSDPVPTIISCSFDWSYDDETSYISSTQYGQLHQLFIDAANLGITVLVASGDQGASGDSATQAQTLYPATDPYVLSCGGTTVGNIDTSTSTFDEWVWNDVFVYSGGSQPGATGGGISALYPVPPYQEALTTLPLRNNTGTAGRGIPDVAGNASANNGYAVTVGGTMGVNAGTSAVAPFYSGLVALLNENFGQSVGFLNPTLYALGNTVCRDVTAAQGPTNNNFNPGTGIVTGYTAGPGWDACTGLGSIDGSALLAILQGTQQVGMTFIMDRSTFGQDEVNATGGVFNQAFFVVVDGLKPADFPGAGITATAESPTPPSLSQLSSWAPKIPSPMGPSGATNITFTPTSVDSEGASLSPEVQRFTFTYKVTFPDQTVFTNNPSSDFPLSLTLSASLAVSGGPSPVTTQIELVEAADPYFSSESNGGQYWLSEDLRVFYAEEGSTLFGAPPLGSTPTDALSFINWIITNISGPLGTGPNGDTFENTLTPDELSSALSLNPTTVNSSGQTLSIYNFAIARVRLDGTSAAEKAKTVRAFFRLFQGQATTTPYQAPGTGAGVSSATGPYRQWSDGTTDGSKVPLLGISSDGTEYITVPCFATKRVANTNSGNDMTTQPDPPNVQPMTPVAGSTVYAYFGCWIDSNQSNLLFPYQPGANPDGPFTGQTLYTLGQVLIRGGHQCLVVEIVDDEAPIPDNATPGTSDKVAQRNLCFTTVSNPGVAPNSRLATHTFEIRPSLTILNADQRPDELMIDWGNVPRGSVASIYLPAVAAADVLSLAARMYSTHHLSASDPHTLRCPTGGITYIPIPQASHANAPNYAGVFSVELPLGIKKGQEFKIVVRQVTSVIGRKGVGSANRRHVYGVFQISIPVSTKEDMLVPEERTLSIMRWIQETIPLSSRWYPVFLRYLDQLAARVNGLGGIASSVPPTQTGIWPGLIGLLGGGHGQGGSHHGPGITGKIDGIVYDHFGDFKGFILVTQEGSYHRFESHERRGHDLVQRAWMQRILTTVFARHGHPEWPLEIFLHGEPPHC